MGIREVQQQLNAENSRLAPRGGGPYEEQRVQTMNQPAGGVLPRQRTVLDPQTKVLWTNYVIIALLALNAYLIATRL